MRIKTVSLLLLILAEPVSGALSGVQTRPVQIELVLLPANGGSWTGDERQTSSGQVIITVRQTAAGVYVAVQRQEERDGSGNVGAACRPVAVLTDMEGLKRFFKTLPAGSTVELNGTCMPVVPIDKDPLSSAGALKELREEAARCGIKFTVYRAG
jgi:hypothetical protein